MGKLHENLSKLGLEKVHRSLHESDDVHVGDGWGEIIVNVEREAHGGVHVQGR